MARKKAVKKAVEKAKKTLDKKPGGFVMDKKDYAVIWTALNNEIKSGGRQAAKALDPLMTRLEQWGQSYFGK